MAYLCWCGNGDQADRRVSLGSLTGFEKKNHSAEKPQQLWILKLNDAYPIRLFNCPKKQTLRFIPNLLLNYFFEAGGGKEGGLWDQDEQI